MEECTDVWELIRTYIDRARRMMSSVAGEPRGMLRRFLDTGCYLCPENWIVKESGEYRDPSDSTYRTSTLKYYFSDMASLVLHDVKRISIGGDCEKNELLVRLSTLYMWCVVCFAFTLTDMDSGLEEATERFKAAVANLVLAFGACDSECGCLRRYIPPPEPSEEPDEESTESTEESDALEDDDTDEEYIPKSKFVDVDAIESSGDDDDTSDEEVIDVDAIESSGDDNDDKFCVHPTVPELLCVLPDCSEHSEHYAYSGNLDPSVPSEGTISDDEPISKRSRENTKMTAIDVDDDEDDDEDEIGRKQPRLEE